MAVGPLSSCWRRQGRTGLALQHPIAASLCDLTARNNNTRRDPLIAATLPCPPHTHDTTRLIPAALVTSRIAVPPPPAKPSPLACLACFSTRRPTSSSAQDILRTHTSLPPRQHRPRPSCSRRRETLLATSDPTPPSTTTSTLRLRGPSVYRRPLSARIAPCPLQHAMSPPRMHPPCKPQATTSGCNLTTTSI